MIKIDTRKSSHIKVYESDLIEKVEAIPLGLPVGEEIEMAECGISGTTVFVMSLHKDKILAFSIADGMYLFSIEVSDKITDFSATDSYVDVLSGNAFSTYEAGTGAMIHKISLDTSVILTGIARRDPDCIVLSGYDKNTDYVGEYYFSTSHLSIIPNPIPIAEENIDTIIGGSRFFYYGGTPYYLYSHTGDIWKYSQFFSPKFRWSFDSTPDIFINAQMTEANVYLSYMANGGYNTLIYHKSSDKYVIVNKTTAVKLFPLGTFHDNVDYYICSAASVNEYMGTDSHTDTFMDNQTILVKYYLP